MRTGGFSDPDGTFWSACDYLDTGRLVECGATSLWVEEEGQGPPLLALHGGPGVDHRSLHPGLTALAQFRRVIYVDLRGHYMSPLPPGEAHEGLATDVADLQALCKTLDLPAVDVFGHSFGGLVALSFAAQHPGSVRRVICCSTPIGASDEQIEARVAADPASQALESVEDEASEEAFERYLDFYLAQPASAAVRHWMRLVCDSYGSARNTALMELREAADAALEPDWPALLARVRCPALVLYGALDPIVVPDMLEQACRGHSNFEVHALASSRHDPFHDEPEQFAELVRRLLES